MSSQHWRTSRDAPAVIAVDVGNSKTDVALVTRAGGVLATQRGPTSSHQQVGVESAVATLVILVEQAARDAGLEATARPFAQIVAMSAAGADLPSDIRLLTRALGRTGLAPVDLVVNDCYGGLRAGTDRGWGICVVCGSGMNCLGVAPNGRTVRFDALGDISGDWGGGGGIGLAGLAAAVRADDGRGPATLLARTVPAHFGVARPRSLTLAMYRGTIPYGRHVEISPLVFDAAGQGDAVAHEIVDRQADEVVAWVRAAIRRLRLQRTDPVVVLAGGVFRTELGVFHSRVDAGIAAVAPGARVRRLSLPPVVGAALLGLDHLIGATTPIEVARRLRVELTDERLMPDRDGNDPERTAETFRGAHSVGRLVDHPARG
jgi:N-acetylglucosamine kinase-like BadF-type ATPase